ncbi:lytic murein transglycosylase [Nocardioides ungokensis]|uniref:lytic murein transglycosylase n=1 Tax=Nocardioides ungokensis TaxID=1643322 RepID=UPI001FE8A515|nr:lytic murein transglycosylase [Nocardioides ungokensis]
MDWTTLAAIGYVESRHGTIGGRTLLDDGQSSTPILGPALDGTGDFAAIRSTPTSRNLHGDPVWEHAVGPMQFLPSTWDQYAADGDGDGRADPLDLDDAAAATAGYLCAGGRDLSTGAGWAAAVFSYNHAQVYVDEVYAAATSYADRSAS